MTGSEHTNPPILIYTTFADQNEAYQIGKTLIQEKLIACINVFPAMTAMYEWEGAIETSEEIAALIKSHKGLEQRIIERIKALHSYDIPAVLVCDVNAGNKDFLSWIYSQTA
ncbi:MAG: divalent-cation tolerance protein CutA [Pseudomonadota bacterium]